MSGDLLKAFQEAYNNLESLPLLDEGELSERLFLDSSKLSDCDKDAHFLSLEDLLQLIQYIQRERSDEDSILADLYGIIADIYRKRLSQGKAQDYRWEQEQAIAYYHKAIELDKKLAREIKLANNLSHLAYLYDSQGRYNEAEPLFLQALELRKRLLGEEHPDVAISLNSLASLYYSQGRYSEAEPLFKQALELMKRLLGEEHPDVAISLNNLANVYNSQGRYSEAEPLFLQALELMKRLLGEEHPSVANSLNSLAILYDSQGRYSEAEPLFLQALELKKRLLGEEHPSVANSLNNLAILYNSQGRYSEAEPLYLQALEISDRTLGSNHPQTATIRENLEKLRTQISSTNYSEDDNSTQPKER